MTDRFFENPILNSPYEYPGQHWELDDTGQPTGRIITPIPKHRKQKRAKHTELVFDDEGKRLSTQAQQYDPTAVINQIR